MTDVASHAHFTHLAATHKIPVIRQKPMAAAPHEAEAMVKAGAPARAFFRA